MEYRSTEYRKQFQKEGCSEPPREPYRQALKRTEHNQIVTISTTYWIHSMFQESYILFVFIQIHMLPPLRYMCMITPLLEVKEEGLAKLRKWPNLEVLASVGAELGCGRLAHHHCLFFPFCHWHPKWEERGKREVEAPGDKQFTTPYVISASNYHPGYLAFKGIVLNQLKARI